MIFQISSRITQQIKVINQKYLHLRQITVEEDWKWLNRFLKGFCLGMFVLLRRSNFSLFLVLLIRKYTKLHWTHFLIKQIRIWSHWIKIIYYEKIDLFFVIWTLFRTRWKSSSFPPCINIIDDWFSNLFQFCLWERFQNLELPNSENSSSLPMCSSPSQTVFSWRPNSRYGALLFRFSLKNRLGSNFKGYGWNCSSLCNANNGINSGVPFSTVIFVPGTLYSLTHCLNSSVMTGYLRRVSKNSKIKSCRIFKSKFSAWNSFVILPCHRQRTQLWLQQSVRYD